MALNIRPLMYARNEPALLFLTFSLVINICFIIRTGYIIARPSLVQNENTGSLLKTHEEFQGGESRALK